GSERLDAEGATDVVRLSVVAPEALACVGPALEDVRRPLTHPLEVLLDRGARLLRPRRDLAEPCRLPAAAVHHAYGATLMYLKPVSAASETITAFGPRRSARRCAPTTLAPDEMPAKIPSSRASRTVIASASSSPTGSRWSTFEASQ